MDAARVIDRPVNRLCDDYSDYMAVVTHPAFRLSFLDAMAGRGFNHEKILDRIWRETPRPSLTERYWGKEVALAQYRYEEGRMVVAEYAVTACNWRFPETPPALVRAWIDRRLKDGR